MEMYLYHNGEQYKILARVRDEAMLLQTKHGDYVVGSRNPSMGTGHYWMTNNHSEAWKDFFKLAYEASGAEISYSEFIEMFREV